MDRSFFPVVEQQILVMCGIGGEGVDQKPLMIPLLPRRCKKALCQIFLFISIVMTISFFAQGLDAVGDMRIQHTDIALRHLYALTVDYLGAVSGIHIQKFNHRVDMLWNNGKTGFLVDTKPNDFFKKASEIELVHLPPVIDHFGDIAISGAKAAVAVRGDAAAPIRCTEIEMFPAVDWSWYHLSISISY